MTVGPLRAKSRYIEAQIHGGVTLDDIEEIVIRTGVEETLPLKTKDEFGDREYEQATYDTEQYAAVIARLKEMGWDVMVGASEIRAVKVS